ncbi:MAG TPA: glycoside hydrolase family 15 protein [Stellaceae bacterium]|nr:glycoside hydrolase family 15 protein [Stellaceae bacterium]
MTDSPNYPRPIEDYALIGDCVTAALVARNGSIDWLCWPRFDSDACLAALLGNENHGHWSIAPAEPVIRVERFYRDDTMVLETVFETKSGTVALVDFMPMSHGQSLVSARTAIVRMIEGRRGKVAMNLHLALRFDFGSSVPWVTKLDDGSGISAIAGPHRVTLRSPIDTHGEDLATTADFTVSAGQCVPFTLAYSRSHRPVPPPLDPDQALAATEGFWRDWSSRCQYQGRWREPVMRSLLTLKALTFRDTGGIVAAPTTSLPEQIGGNRNWDYRFCWLRDATLTLLALMQAGYYDEAHAWRDWLHRSIAGSPDQLQIMYGIAGERRLTEVTVPWLPGYAGSVPVRIGNAASDQLQLDVYGEVMNALHHARDAGLAAIPSAWGLQSKLVEHLETIWSQPDEGIWEVRGGRRQFTFSKVMAWVAIERAVRDAETYGLEAPLDRWRALRDEIHATICRDGFDQKKQAFTQSFGDNELDASLLMMPIVGFLSPDDPRIKSTIAAIERELIADGFVVRYRTESNVDGLPPGEGAFLPCSFWLADNYAMQGRMAEATALFERLLALRNDVGLLAEEYDPRIKRQVGNFPQAFSHIALLGTAFYLSGSAPVGNRAGTVAPAPVAA